MTKEQNKKISPEWTVATILKEARAQKKMTVEGLANAASISMRDLERLEVGDYGHLPSEIYVCSFLERCSRELDIPPDVLSDLYRREALNFKNKKEAGMSMAIQSKRFIITPKFIIIGLSAIGIVLLAAYFWYQLSGLLKPPFLVVENPASDIITNEETIGVSGKTQKDSRIFINGKEIEVDTGGAFRNDFYLEAGTVNTVEVKSVNRFSKETVLIRRIIKN